MTRKTVIGFISVSDRASQGAYEDKGIPALSEWIEKVMLSPYETHEKIIPDNRETIEKTLTEFSDNLLCDLIFTTGGTGPTRRDVTPEATLAVATKELQGFGEQMRRISLNFVPTAILSRQTAVIRETEKHATLIVNLPGQPRAIAEILGGFKNEKNGQIVHGIFSSIPYCLELIGGPVIECDENLCTIWRPKKH